MRPISPSLRSRGSHGDRSRHAGVVIEVLRAVLPHRAFPHCRRLCLLAVEQETIRSRGRVHPPRRGQAMAVDERDPHTGYTTTGHEWNGIKELNTPVPRVVYFFLIVTALFSVVYWVLMPAWPLGLTYTKGLLGIDQRTTVTEALKQAALEREVWTRRIGTESYQAIQNDPKLMTIVRQTGRTLFGDNCAACHGFDAKGGKGFPNLTTSSWLWGGDPETIAETIRVGINSAHPNTRAGQMLAFGRDRILQPDEVDNVVDYVQSLSDPNISKQIPAA